MFSLLVQKLAFLDFFLLFSLFLIPLKILFVLFHGVKEDSIDKCVCLSIMVFCLQLFKVHTKGQIVYPCQLMATYHMVGPRLHFTQNGILPLFPIYTPTNLLNIPPNSMPNCMPGCLRAIFYVNSRQASGVIINHCYLSDLGRNLPGTT